MVAAVTALAVIAILQPGSDPASAFSAFDVAVESGFQISGRARVVDGDTLEVASQPIRLHGIDAFEGDQTCHDAQGRARACGRAATRSLVSLIAGAPVICQVRDVDHYGRYVSTCEVGGRDMGAHQVATGHALAYRRYSAAYVPTEVRARLARAGAWDGSFDRPEQWRRRG